MQLTAETIVDEKILHYWLTRHEDKIFLDYKPHARLLHNPIQRHIFIDNRADILVVSHMDTVQTLLDRPRILPNGIISTGLDDRLGCYICAMLAKWGVKADILFTDLEETGRTTAKHFESKKRYNWVAEFDRAGEDYVTYRLDSTDFNDTMKGFGFDKSWGSFSDICELTIPGNPCMFNMGIGYEWAHDKDSYTELDVLARQMNRFFEFYKQFGHVHFPQYTVQTSTSRNNEHMYEEEWYEAYYDSMSSTEDSITVQTTAVNQNEEDDTDRCPQCNHELGVKEICDDKCSMCDSSIQSYDDIEITRTRFCGLCAKELTTSEIENDTCTGCDSSIISEEELLKRGF